MNYVIKFSFWVVSMGFLISCGGSLTPEQRAKAKKAIEEGQIKRISPVELTETTTLIGNTIAKQINEVDPFLNNTAFIDSLSSAYQVKIFALRPGMDGLSKEEQSIAEAYQSQGDIAGVKENVQQLPGDSMLYTYPVGNERPDGSRPFSHAIAIKMSIKKIVLSIEK